MNGKQMQEALDVLCFHGQVEINAAHDEVFVHIPHPCFSPEMLSGEDRERLKAAGWEWRDHFYAHTT